MNTYKLDRDKINDIMKKLPKHFFYKIRDLYDSSTDSESEDDKGKNRVKIYGKREGKHSN